MKEMKERKLNNSLKVSCYIRAIDISGSNPDISNTWD
jgi:hypothetical protein